MVSCENVAGGNFFFSSSCVHLPSLDGSVAFPGGKNFLGLVICLTFCINYTLSILVSGYYYSSLEELCHIPMMLIKRL